MKIYILLLLWCIGNIVNAQNFKWVNTFGSSAAEFGYSVKTAPDGKVYVTGSFSEELDIDPSPAVMKLTSQGSTDIFIVCYDSTGEFLWAKSVGGEGSDEGFSLALDISGNVYVTGYFQNNVDFDPDGGSYPLIAQGIKDMFVLKLTNEGTFLWAKDIGGTKTTIGKSIFTDADGNIALTGYFKGITNFNPDGSGFYLTSVGFSNDAFVLRLNPDGGFIWAFPIAGPGFDEGWSIQMDGAGNVYAVGSFEQGIVFDSDPMISEGGKDIYLIKLDKEGHYVYSKSIGSDIDDVCKALALDASGNLYLSGYFQQNADFDPGAGEYYLSSKGDYDVFILKLDSEGAFVYAKSMGGTEPEEAKGIAVDAAGNVYATGGFNGTADFNPGMSEYFLEAPGESENIFIVKLDAVGNFSWASSIGSTGIDVGAAIALRGQNIYTTGVFNETVDFDPNMGIENYEAIGGGDCYLLKLNQKSSMLKLVDNVPATPPIDIYPNPSTGIFNINTRNLSSPYTITICNNLGQIIYQSQENSTPTEVDLSHFPEGSYFISITTPTNSSTHKVIHLK